ncbi:ferritin-like protein [Parabacteroides sp. PFB2-12]|uniref:hypothetical protein n=1 Tax=unclassified Parabacteroides TaxID=2649774 RepID=UPI002474079D|nr:MULTISPECIES: hypothetical protein [unclassified Parabacteroides]MDH6342931.1 ferritin-like protein [Parabacteroides sp. PM6-13]MDH6391054.1 ferritin-like protein [Parabacteroides sp. PFB2-12]
MKTEEEIKIRLVDIPLEVTFGEICRNVSNAYKIMQAITEGRTNDAFDLAKTILNENDAIHDRQINKQVVLDMLNESGSLN